MMSDATTSQDAPSVSGVHSLDHFVMAVPSLDEAMRFFSAFGLDVRAEGSKVMLRTFGDEHVWGVLVRGAVKRLHHLSFGASAADLRALDSRIAGLGIERAEAPDGFLSNGLWLYGPDRILIEIRAAEKSSPAVKHPPRHRSVAAGERGTLLGTPSLEQVRPTRLSHCLMFVSDVAAAIDFSEAVLGMRLSDKSGEVIAFLHGVHGSDHHMVAFAKAEGPGYHHSSWAVDSVEEIGRGALQMAREGFDRGWGLGRHTMGSNFFHYVQDPWGSFAEYSCDMDFIEAGHRWDAKDFPAADALALWGPKPPADFIRNYELSREGYRLD